MLVGVKNNNKTEQILAERRWRERERGSSLFFLSDHVSARVGKKKGSSRLGSHRRGFKFMFVTSQLCE